MTTPPTVTRSRCGVTKITQGTRVAIPARHRGTWEIYEVVDGYLEMFRGHSGVRLTALLELQSLEGP